jgi:hypothetical protein
VKIEEKNFPNIINILSKYATKLPDAVSKLTTNFMVINFFIINLVQYINANIAARS